MSTFNNKSKKQMNKYFYPPVTPTHTQTTFGLLNIKCFQNTALYICDVAQYCYSLAT